MTFIVSTGDQCDTSVHSVHGAVPGPPVWTSGHAIHATALNHNFLYLSFKIWNMRPNIFLKIKYFEEYTRAMDSFVVLQHQPVAAQQFKSFLIESDGCLA